MKKIFGYLLIVPTLALAFTSCSKKEEHQKGEPDVEGCYGVFFSPQISEIVMDPADPTVYDIEVARTRTDGDISVPFVYEDEDTVFVVGEIAFNDGQSETTLHLEFSKAKVGVPYTIHFLIEDPLYASRYSQNAVAFDFTVTRDKWKDLGKGKYTEDFITTFYGVANITYQLEMQENDKKPGLYRIKNPYGEPYLYNEPGDYDDTKDYFMEIDAQDKNGVFIKEFESGCNWGYGEFVMWSIADYYMEKEGYDLKQCKDEGLCGKNEGGILTFPQDVLLIQIAGYTGFYPANGSEAFKVVLPGVVEVDYSVKMTAGFAKDGNLPVNFKLGEDVAKVKYAAFEGELNSFQIDAKAADIDEGITPSKSISTSGTYNFNFSSTSVYTIVAVGYDTSDVNQSHSGCSFGYVAKGDTVAVILNTELICTKKYEPFGFSSDNTLEFTIFGNELAAVRVGIFETDSVKQIPAKCDSILMNDPDAVLPDSLLSLVNSYGLTDIFTVLNPGTDYTMLVWASNGFEQKVDTATAKTTGSPMYNFISAATQSRAGLNLEAEHRPVSAKVSPSVSKGSRALRNNIQPVALKMN